MAFVELICLAYSRKEGGCCVVGIDTATGGWARPASGVPGLPLKPSQCILDDGSIPGTLDLIRVDLGERCPHTHQIENRRTLPGRWKLLARPAPQSIMPLLKTNIEYGESIFDDRAVYLTFAGAQARAGRGSVALIAPRGIRLFWQTKFRTQLRTSFYIGNSHYCLPVTDIAFEKLAGDVVKGKWVHLKDLNLVAAGGRILFTVTLGEPFQPEGFREPLCYKLVSGVSVLPPSMA